ncbi:MAG: hypothetical protein DRH50_00455 [Deltaproteobacteria bacterium]|nr:MAG: hypothetical protein DRH50_00455 [Deltaproteobacteria bacterium]
MLVIRYWVFVIMYQFRCLKISFRPGHPIVGPVVAKQGKWHIFLGSYATPITNRLKLGGN